MGKDDRSVRPPALELPCTLHHELTYYFSGAGLCIGGPYLVYYVTPTEEELFTVRFAILQHPLTTLSGLSGVFGFVIEADLVFQRYNPELQRRSLENRQQKQENFNEWVHQLKKHSKSELPSKSHCLIFSRSVFFVVSILALDICWIVLDSRRLVIAQYFSRMNLWIYSNATID